jgi:cleavage stimulation factor subunit 3
MDTTVKPEPQDSPVPPPSEYDALNVRLLQNPHQPEIWRRLVNVAEATGEISKISAAYDALLKQFPNTVCGGLVHFRFFFCRSPLDLCSGFGSNPIYQPLFEH